MASRPLVSVIIPTYNQRPDYLRQCIDSVIGQTYDNIEIIVSDNHSTSQPSRDVLTAYKDRRLRVIKPPQHMDLVPHFQWASEQASGGYISFLSSDDWLEKNVWTNWLNLYMPIPKW